MENARNKFVYSVNVDPVHRHAVAASWFPGSKNDGRK